MNKDNTHEIRVCEWNDQTGEWWALTTQVEFPTVAAAEHWIGRAQLENFHQYGEHKHYRIIEETSTYVAPTR